MEQAAFGFWRPRPIKVAPPRRKVRRYKLLDRRLKDGPRVTFRVAPGEAQQLVAEAKRTGMSVSELIRDALYETYEIGELGEELSQ